MSKNNIKLSINELVSIIKEAVENKISESIGYDIYDSEIDAKSCFDDVKDSFDYELKQKLPNHEFEYDVDSDGEVTVMDITTGKWYKGSGEIEYETKPLGYPDTKKPYSEAEGEVGYYSFTNALKEVLKKIDEDTPDEQDYV